MRRVLLALLGVAGVACNTHALTVELGPGNSGIGSLTYTVNWSTKYITLNEVWTGTGMGVLKFTFESGDSTSRADWHIVKNIQNNSGSPWTRLANELLDLTVDSNDPTQPSWVPSGWSTSSDTDGLSFGQGLGYPRTSTTFGSLIVDELTHNRDFLDFYNGTLVSGGTDIINFGLTTPNNASTDAPWLLVQRPNAVSAPVPDAGATFGLLALAFLGLASLRRARNQ